MHSRDPAKHARYGRYFLSLSSLSFCHAEHIQILPMKNMFWWGVVTHGSEGFQSFGLGWQALWEAMTFFLLSFRNSASVSHFVFTNPATNRLFLRREASVFWFWTKKEASIVPWPLKRIHNFLHTLGHHILSRIYRLKWILVNGNSFSSLRNSCLACLHFKGNLVLGSHKLFFFKICWLIKKGLE